MYCRPLSANLTGSFPIGCILVLFTALGMIWDGSRLSSCSPRQLRATLHATDISAPKSGRAGISTLPLRDDMWILMVGAGLTLLPLSACDAFIYGSWWVMV